MTAAGEPPADLADRLRAHRLFGRLDDGARAALAGRLQHEAFDAGQTVADGIAPDERLGWLVRGRVALRPRGAQRPVAWLNDGEWFGAGSLPADDALAWAVVAEQPSEIAFLSLQAIVQLRAEHASAARWLPAPLERVAAPAVARATDEASVGEMAAPVGSMLRRAPVTLAASATIREVAQTMREHGVSSVLLLEQAQLAAIVTDRDLRNRVLATGLDPGCAVLEVATPAPLTLDIRQPAFDALLLMTRHNVHHVPVMDGARLAGMVTATDLFTRHGASAVFIGADIYRQDSIEGLRLASSRIVGLQQQLAAGGATAHATGHIVTSIADAVTIRLLQLAEADLGPPPVRYAWVAAGSQGRSEQSARSDQDNCLLLDDAYDAPAHGAYFESLSRFVCDGLDACGWVHCPGGIMAMNDTWRQPLQVWKNYFWDWITQPDPVALMMTCTFFDMRLVHGSAVLVDGLRAEVLDSTQGNGIFLSHLLGNALTREPPLGLFGRITPQRSGAHRGMVNLKHQGIVPIVDLARIYALAGGHTAVNTHDRLEVAALSEEVSKAGAHDLRDALEFLSLTRIRHQMRRIAAGLEADNFLALDELSNFERTQLKDAFAVVRTHQQVLTQRYGANRFG